MTKVIGYKMFAQKDADTYYAVVSPFGVKPFGAEKWLAISAASRGALSCRDLGGSYTLREFSSIHRVTHSFFVENK